MQSTVRTFITDEHVSLEMTEIFAILKIVIMGLICIEVHLL